MDELYVIARRVLLDAFCALVEHRDAVILVGAQAIYLRVGEADVAIAPYTTDGDLAIEPALLGEIPPLEEALHQAGFRSETDSSVGVWVTHRPTSYSLQTKVSIDLLVPSLLSPGKGRRGAQLSGHDRKVARKVKGLDGIVVDYDRLVLGALEQEDSRLLRCV